MSSPAIEPLAVVRLVESYVDRELTDSEKYDNRQPLDGSGVYSLHAVASAIYALGFNDGETAEQARQFGRSLRDRTLGGAS